MEVTKENFQEVLLTLPDVLSKAQFLAFDTEFTGLRVEGASPHTYFDTLDDLYLKDRLKAETFMAIQFGLVAFIYDETQQKYTNQAYNFYVYPSSYADISFTCQSNTIEFLIQNDFDFNKLFKHGIPYLKDSEIDKLLERLEEKHNNKSNQLENSSKSEFEAENSIYVTEVINNIEEILVTNSKKSFTTERCTRFIRKSIYNAVQNKFGSKVFLETNKDETMTISVGFNDDEIKKMQNESYLKEKNKILNEAGFCKVVKLMVESKKLIIGHNLFIDILFTVRQFLTTLPNNYVEFKQLTTFLFPKIVDTKYMVSTCGFNDLKGTSLPNLVQYFEGRNSIPEVDPVKHNEPNNGYNINHKKYHEAAYDAYLTGLCFLAMSKVLGGSGSFKNLPESSFLQPVLNKLSVRRMSDISFMNIGGADAEPDRSGVYHLTFPKEWKRKNITELFKNFGFINISWINSTSAFVKVKSEYIREVEKNLMIASANYKLRTYEEYRSCAQSNDDTLVKRSDLERDTVNSNSSFTFDTNYLLKKRQLEDIGEVISRPSKKKFTS